MPGRLVDATNREAMVALAAGGVPLPSPVEAYFEVANRCNSKCVTCPITFSPHEEAKQLSLDEFRVLVEQLPDLKRAVLQGIGEPLLNRDLAPMIRHLKDRGVYVVFNTNAVLLTRRRQLELIDSGLDELRVSVDGSTPETYLRVRGIPAFDRVVDNVAAMVRLQREQRATTPRLSFWVTGMRENLPELPGVIDLAARIGVGEVYLQRMVFGFALRQAQDERGALARQDEQGALARQDERGALARQDEQGALARQEQSIYSGYRAQAEALIGEAERRAESQGVVFRGAGALSPRESIIDRQPMHEPWRACSRPLRLAYVTAQGTALPCCIAPFTDAPYESITLGNYLRDGVDGVWSGEAYRVFRERLYSSNPPTACQNCGLAWSL